MILKEVVLKRLEGINDKTNYLAVLNHIVDKKYYEFGEAKTLGSIISTLLGDYF